MSEPTPEEQRLAELAHAEKAGRVIAHNLGIPLRRPEDRDARATAHAAEIAAAPTTGGL